METKLQPMNLHQLLINPTGSQTAFMASRTRIIEDLNNRYMALLSKAKNFNFKIYKKKDDYYFVFKIPSEKYSANLFYDVVIHFISDDETKNEKSIRNYKIKLFSNSPAFTFTYTYVLNKNDMLVDILKSKCSDRALTEPPITKNPVEVYGFEKSCYFACRYIQEHGLVNKFDLNNNVYLYSEMNIKRNISSDVDKLKEYNLVKNSMKKGKKTSNNLVKPKKPSDFKSVNNFKKKKPLTAKTGKTKTTKMKKK